MCVYGWLKTTQPDVFVLTNGSGRSHKSRIASTTEVLAAAHAKPGPLYGAFTDRDFYRALLDFDFEFFARIVTGLAGSIMTKSYEAVSGDAAEGYNPVHDLCRLIGGAAIEMAGVSTAQFEYSVVDDPDSPRAKAVVELTAAEHAAKMARARAQAASLADIEALIARYGADAYRRETLSPVADWETIDGGGPPLYERYGEERVAAGQYQTVIRQREHMLPLRDALRAAVEKRSCAF